MSIIMQDADPLQDKSRLFQLLVEGLVDYALFMLDPAGLVVSWNEGAQRIKGYRADEVLGRHFSMFYTDQERLKGLPAAALHHAAEHGRHACEAQRVRKDGSVFWADIVLDSVRDESGRLIWFAKITRDVSERKRIQQELVEKERSLRLLLDGVSDHALCLLDPEGVVKTWNGGSQRLRGYTAEEIIGRNFEIFYLPEMRAQREPKRALEQALANGRHDEEGIRCRKDGSIFWAMSTIEPARDETGELVGFALLARDITQQKRMEDARAILAAAFEGGPNAIVIVDAELKLCQLNGHFAKLHDWHSEDLIGRSLHELLPEDCRANVISHFRRAIEGREFRQFRLATGLIGLRRDGSGFPLEIMARSLRRAGETLIIAIFRDISELLAEETAAAARDRERAVMEERAKGAAELRRLSETLSKIIEASPLGIVGYAGGEVAIWNSAARSIFGLEALAPDEAVRRIGEELAPEGELSGDDLRSMVREQGAIRNVEVKRRHADGRPIDLNVSGAPLTDEAGRLDGYVFVLDDVTQQKHLDAQLRQARKMEAVGQLTGGIAHDFNNLLAIIMGNLELLKEGPPDDPERFELLEDALNAANRGASLTHRLLAYSRQQPLAPSLTDIRNLIKDMQSVLFRVLEESVEIRTTLAADLWSVKIDAHQLENALLNLALNARDAMPAGGVLAIAAENTILDPAYAQENADVGPGPYVEVSVSDTGIGMSKETVERALEPFFTTKPVGQGTGLGLSMVYGFVKQSGGHLKIYSELGYGTTVKLFLPKFASSADGPSVAVSAPDRAPPMEKLVLVVEDEISVRRLQLRFLDSLGYRTLEARDGPSALALIEQHPEIDLLLSDVVMPGGFSGPALYEQAVKRIPGLEVVFMSGYAPQAVIREEELRGKPVLSKPFPRAVLAAALQRIFAMPDNGSRRLLPEELT